MPDLQHFNCSTAHSVTEEVVGVDHELAHVVELGATTDEGVLLEQVSALLRIRLQQALSLHLGLSLATYSPTASS
jgi:hypothetical protein